VERHGRVPGSHPVGFAAPKEHRLVCGRKGTTVVCVQPQEPATGPAPQPPPPPAPATPTIPAPRTAPGAGRLRNRRARLIMAMVLGVVGLLCLGGVGVAVSLYDDATEIKRTAPDAVVDNFLGAYLANRDDKSASLYTCRSAADLGKLAAFRADIQSREKRYTIGIRATWRNFDVHVENGRATIKVDIVRTISDGSEETSDRWQFQLVDDGGWRVCAAEPLG
jgi:hypothetical protein